MLAISGLIRKMWELVFLLVLNGVTILILLLHIEKYVVVIRKNQMIIHLNQGGRSSTVSELRKTG